MKREELKELISKLDSDVYEAEAKVALKRYGGGLDESKVIANEAGYLRLGIEFLKAAFASKDADCSDNSIEVDVTYLLSGKSDIWLDWFVRSETPELEDLPEEQEPPKSGKYLTFGIFTGFFVILALALYGAVKLFS